MQFQELVEPRWRLRAHGADQLCRVAWADRWLALAGRIDYVFRHSSLPLCPVRFPLAGLFLCLGRGLSARQGAQPTDAHTLAIWAELDAGIFAPNRSIADAVNY